MYQPNCPQIDVRVVKTILDVIKTRLTFIQGSVAVGRNKKDTYEEFNKLKDAIKRQIESLDIGEMSDEFYFDSQNYPRTVSPFGPKMS